VTAALCMDVFPTCAEQRQAAKAQARNSSGMFVTIHTAAM